MPSRCSPTRVKILIVLVTIVHTMHPNVALGESVFGRTTPSPVATEPASLTGQSVFANTTSSSSLDVTTLQKQLEAKRKNIEDIQKRIQEYQKKIEAQRGRASTLQNQLSILGNSIDAAKLRIDETTSKIDKTNLEFKEINAKVAQSQREVAGQKESLAHLLRLMNAQEERPVLAVLLTEQTVSAYYDALQGTKQRQEDMNGIIDRLEVTLQTYQLQQAALAQKHIELARFDQELKDRRLSLESEQSTQQIILGQTKNSEKKYQQLLSAERAEQLGADAEIRKLEAVIREKLKEKGLDSRLTPDGAVSFMWPVPNQGVSAYFHDPSYPFRNVFEHPAIDLRTLRGGKSTNGLPVRAAASGYVARARDGGANGYSYVMIIHNNQFSTVYGHLLQINVAQDEFVAQGQVIGLNGGAPGTHGAGGLTTGPHLHFEVRKNGIPVNPLDYLP